MTSGSIAFHFVTILRCRSISKSSRPDDDVYAEIPASAEEGSAFHLVAYGHPLNGAGERVHQGPVLVHLRTDRCHNRVVYAAY